MRRFRQGNDVHLVWTITNNNSSEVSLSGANVYLIDTFKHTVPFSCTIVKNKISGTFYGKDQITKGKYRLKLVLNEGTTNMTTIDYVDAFIITDATKSNITGTDDEDTSYYEFTSDIASTGGYVDLSSYYTKEEVDEKIEDIDVTQILPNYALKTYVDDKFTKRLSYTTQTKIKGRYGVKEYTLEVSDMDDTTYTISCIFDTIISEKLNIDIEEHAFIVVDEDKNTYETTKTTDCIITFTGTGNHTFTIKIGNEVWNGDTVVFKYPIYRDGVYDELDTIENTMMTEMPTWEGYLPVFLSLIITEITYDNLQIWVDEWNIPALDISSILGINNRYLIMNELNQYDKTMTKDGKSYRVTNCFSKAEMKAYVDEHDDDLIAAAKGHDFIRLMNYGTDGILTYPTSIIFTVTEAGGTILLEAKFDDIFITIALTGESDDNYGFISLSMFNYSITENQIKNIFN